MNPRSEVLKHRVVFCCVVLCRQEEEMRREKVKNESSRGWNYLANQLRTPHLDFRNLLHPQPLDISATSVVIHVGSLGNVSWRPSDSPVR
jgi:hypothetical protein